MPHQTNLGAHPMKVRLILADGTKRSVGCLSRPEHLRMPGIGCEIFKRIGANDYREVDPAEYITIRGDLERRGLWK